ncbi:MAG: glutamate cyclase domain-containing protein [Parahaliea sp.]
MNEAHLSEAVEALLVARNPRQMQMARQALTSGYYRRAATLLYQALQQQSKASIIIGTGFPVAGTFETDGPVGAIALYQALTALDGKPVLACAEPLYSALCEDYRCLALTARDIDSARQQASEILAELQPGAIIAIEHPGLCDDGRYYNMRGEDISPYCGIFDPFVEQTTGRASCPTIGIGDGGNEIGMGRIADTIATLNIRASVTTCDELLVADVSNWAAYGLILFLAYWSKQDLLADTDPLSVLGYLSAKGSVDGISRKNTLTEDGLDVSEGCAIIAQLRQLGGFGH